MKAVSVWAEGYRSVLDDGRGHSVVVDLPTDQNGTNAGPTALELCLMSLAGCTTTIFKIVAGKRNFAYKAFKVELEAEKPEGALTVTGVKGKMEIVTGAEEKEAETVLRLTLKTCPVGVIFANAKIKYEWTLTVKKT
jgi:putative redox protein